MVPVPSPRRLRGIFSDLYCENPVGLGEVVSQNCTPTPKAGPLGFLTLWLVHTEPQQFFHYC